MNIYYDNKVSSSYKYLNFTSCPYKTFVTIRRTT